MDEPPLLCAYRFDAAGCPSLLSPLAALQALRSRGDGDGFAWFHVRRGHPRLQAWLKGGCLPEEALSELTTGEEAVPFVTSFPGQCLLLRLRSFAAERADGGVGETYSLSLLLQPDRVITSGPLSSVRALGRRTEDAIRAHEPAFASPAVLAARLVESALDEAQSLVDKLRTQVDEQELIVGDATLQTVMQRSWRHSRHVDELQDALIAELGGQRRTAVRLRRWMAPLRTVLASLAVKAAGLAGEEARATLGRNCEACDFLLDELENLREQSSVLKDELMGLHEARTARALYLQSMISALFLPMSFITGLLSMYLTYPDYISGTRLADDYDYYTAASPPPPLPPSGAIPFKPPQGTPRTFYFISAGCLATLASAFAGLRRLRWL